MLRVFIGSDTRQPLALSVLASSITRHSSVPVAITPLVLSQLPVKRRGLTEFTFSRFLVPFLADYAGPALFLDADMVVTGDIAKLFACAEPGKYSVQVMRNQPKFEWASAMLFNAACCRPLTPQYVNDAANNLFDLAWARGAIGDIPDEWNHCVSYAKPRTDAKLYHFTAGIPCWEETAGEEEDAIWLEAFEYANATCSYAELMGNSVHAKRTRAA